MSEWKEYKLGECVTVLNGYAFKSSDFKNTQLKDFLPVIKIKNVANGDVTLNDVQYHHYSEEYNNYVLSKGDILIALTGNHSEAKTQVVGGVSLYKLNKKALLNQRVAKIIPHTNIVNEKYLYYLMKEDNFHMNIASKASGSASQANISKKDIEEMVILLPSLTKQDEIASILSSLDDKIDLLNRENATLEAMAETLFRQWFIEEAKEDWEEGKLEDEFDFTMGQSPSGDSFNEEGVGIPMYQGNADFGFRFPTRRVYTTQPTRFAEVNDTLISVRAPVGAQNMAMEKCCIGRGVAAFRYKKKPSYFSYTYYKFKSLLEEIKQFNDNGTVFGAMSKSDFENLEITIPDENTIMSFQQQVKIIDDKIVNNNNEIQTLIQTRDGLLQKLMGGEMKI